MSETKTMSRRRTRALFIASAVAAMAPLTQAADTGWNQTAAGPWDYNDTANWVGGAVTGNWDASLTLTAGQTVTLGTNTVLSTGLSFNYAGSQNVTFRGQDADRTLTLGGDITVAIAANRTITFGSTSANQALNINLGGVTRNFTALSNRTLSIVNVMSNGAIVATGGVFNLSAANTYEGGTTINAGNFSLNGATGSAANSNFLVNTNRGGTSMLTFNSSTSGVTGATRVKSLTLNGFAGIPGGNSAATLQVTGNATADSIDTITNGLTVTGGFSIVSLTPNAAKNTRLTAASFTREANSTVLFRGADLGVSTIASQTAGDANVTFTAAPTLVGGTGANTTDGGIIIGAYGDSAGTTGLSALPSSGLVTYDSTYGVRLLAASEFKTAITSGQSQLDNVKLSNTGGAGVATTNLTSSATINSLSFSLSGTGIDGGVTVSGDPDTKLVLNSGTIYAIQGITGVTSSSNSMILSVPTIDLNGREGVVISATSGISSGRGGGLLVISGNITNDGGNGVIFGGTGTVRLSGTNSYTGTTYINNGVVILSGGIDSTIIGDIVINNGTLDNAGNRIADTASITLNNGSINMRTGNEGSSKSETYTNLTMNGGSYNTGSGGHSGASRIQGYAVFAGGVMSVQSATKVTVSGMTTLSGTVVTVGNSDSALNATSVFAPDGGLTLVNPTSGAYTPITVNSHATSLGGRLQLVNDVTFTGNGTNTITLTIAATENINRGTVGLVGTRSFNIGDGAAASDVTITAAIVDGGSVGGINKTGLGTLDLQFANSYTGGTNVAQGRVIVGATASLGTGNVTVAAGAVLELDGNLAIDDNATLTVLAGGTNGLVDLGFVGTENVGLLVLGGVTYTTGTFDAANYGDYFTGGGTINVVPEPSTLGLLTLAGALGLRRRRRVR